MVGHANVQNVSACRPSLFHSHWNASLFAFDEQEKIELANNIHLWQYTPPGRPGTTDLAGTATLATDFAESTMLHQELAGAFIGTVSGENIGSVSETSRVVAFAKDTVSDLVKDKKLNMILAMRAFGLELALMRESTQETFESAFEMILFQLQGAQNFIMQRLQDAYSQVKSLQEIKSAA